MPTLTITKTYLNGNVLTETDLDNIRNSLTTFFNTTLIDSTNIQTGGIVGSNLANSTVGTAQIAAGAITTAQIASSAVTTAVIGPLAVNQSQIALGAVGAPQRAATISSTSISCGTFSTTNASWTDVTNMSLSITTFGHPVFVGISGDRSSVNSTASNIQIIGQLGQGYVQGFVQILRDGTAIHGAALKVQSATSAAHQLSIPVGSVWFFDPVVAGTYNYKVQVRSETFGNSFLLNYSSLYAYEL